MFIFNIILGVFNGKYIYLLSFFFILAVSGLHTHSFPVHSLL